MAENLSPRFLELMKSLNSTILAVLAAAGLAATWSNPVSGAETPYSSEEKARQALAVLQSDAPPQEKAVACKRLAVYAGPEAVPALAPLLGDELLASWARIPLEVIPGPAPDAALREALGRLRGNLLVGVINSIGVRGDRGSVEALVAKLKDADDEVASAAAVALGKIGDGAAVAALEGAFAGVGAGVRSAVAEGLILCAEKADDAGRWGDAMRIFDAVRRAEVPDQRRFEATRGAILARGGDGVPLLLEALRAADAGMFGIGLRVARELPGRLVTDALAAELDRTPVERQGALLLALADRTDDGVRAAVNRAVGAGAKSLRLAAIGVLERQGDIASLDPLLEAAAGADPEVSKAAKAALGRLPGREVDTAIAGRLAGASGEDRLVLVELAGQRRISAAVPELFKAAAADDADLRLAGVQALGATAAPSDLGALADLLVRSDSEDDQAELEAALDDACNRITDKAACAPPLLARLGAGSAAARSSLLRVLGTVGTPDALVAVRESLKHGDAGVRDAAFRVLADWQDSAALPALVEVIRAPESDTQRTLALRGAVRLLGLGDQPPAKAVRVFGDLLALAPRADDRKLLLSGLGAVADPAAVGLVEPLLADAAVRKEAESALLTLAGGLVGSDPDRARALASRLKTESGDATIRERAEQVLQRMDSTEDYITAWQYAGAYTIGSGSGGSLFATEFPPEKGGEGVAWRPLKAGNQAARPWMMDLLATRTGEARCAGYARTWVHSGKAQPARIEFGTDDGHKLWLNGERIAQADRGGAAVPGEFKTIVSLREGWNLLLLKVVQDTGPWEFCLRLRAPGGGRLDGLRVQAVPPEP
jgi:HEAT repeat protein